MILYPYNAGSESAKELAKALDVKRIKKEGSAFKGAAHKLVINWGNSMVTPEVAKCQVLNDPKAVEICTNKLKFFEFVHQKNMLIMDNDDSPLNVVNIPWYSTSKDDAIHLLDVGGRNNSKVVCRTVLNGHSGDGIVIASRPDELVDAPLYVQYIPKKSEYRVHVMHGQVVDVQRKARDHSIPDDQVNWQIRNHKFGFVFVRDDNPEDIPKNVLTNALDAVKMVGLDFGAVDVIYNQKLGRATVLEINTAPGLTGTTLEGYVKRLQKFGEIYASVLKAKKKRQLRPLGQAVPERGVLDEAKAEWYKWNEAQGGVFQRAHLGQPVEAFNPARVPLNPGAEIAENPAQEHLNQFVAALQRRR